MAESHSQKHHILPLSVYLAVGTALLVLTGVTVWVASYDFGAFNLVVAMSIAAFKAALVAAYFMHLLYDSKIYLLILLTAIAFLAVFIIFTMFDTMTRDQIYEIKAAPIEPDAVIYREAVDTTAGVTDTTAAEVIDTTAGDTSGH